MATDPNDPFDLTARVNRYNGGRASTMRPLTADPNKKTEDPFDRALDQFDQRKAMAEKSRMLDAPDDGPQRLRVAKELGVNPVEIGDVRSAEKTAKVNKLSDLANKSSPLKRAVEDSPLGIPLWLESVASAETAYALFNTWKDIGGGALELATKLPGRITDTGGKGMLKMGTAAGALMEDVLIQGGQGMRLVAAMKGVGGIDSLQTQSVSRSKRRAARQATLSSMEADVKASRAKYDSDNYVVEGLLAGGESVPLTAAAAAVSLINPAAGAALIGGMVGGESVMEARAKGMSDGESLLYGGLQAAPEYFFERYSLAALMKVPARGFVKGVGKYLAVEMPGEIATTISQTFTDWAMLPENENKTIGDWTNSLPDAVAKTALGVLTGGAVVGGTLAGVGKGVQKIGETRQKAARGRQEQAFLTKIGDASQSAAIRNSNPEAWANMLRNYGLESGVSSVLVDGEAVRAYMQSEDYDAASDPIAEYAEQAEAAAAAGGSLALPIEFAAGVLPGTPAWAALKEDMRLSVGGMTGREALAAEEAEKVLGDNLDEKLVDEMSAGIQESQAKQTKTDKLVSKMTEKLAEAGYTQSEAEEQAKFLVQMAETREADLPSRTAESSIDEYNLTQIMPPELQRAMMADEREMVVNALRGRTAGVSGRALAGAAELGKMLTQRGWSAKDMSDEELVEVIDKMRPKGSSDGREYFANRGGRPSQRDSEALAGAPKIDGQQFGPIAGIVAAARSYADANGIAFGRQSEYVDVDEALASRIAQAYEEMEHAPNDPAVAEAYADLIAQVMAQYEALVASGLTFTFGDPDGDYFSSGFNSLRDLRDNNSMQVFPTAAAYGPEGSELDVSDNPMLADTGIRWMDHEGNEQIVYANDLFRAVHDAFGHGMEGAGFRARGEENAWQAHAKLFTGPALGALTSETRGQNSWLNYGPMGETNRTAKIEDTDFAEQKTGLMPEWTWTEGRVADQIVVDDFALEQAMIEGEVGLDTGDGAMIGWTPQRIDTLLNAYAYTDSDRGGDTKAFAVRLSPDQFLGLTASERGQELIQERVDGSEEYGGGQIDYKQMRANPGTIFLVVNKEGGFVSSSFDDGGAMQSKDVPLSGRVRGHEGRHRMTMLKKAGVTSVPVVVIVEDKAQLADLRASSARLNVGPQRSRDQVSNGSQETVFENMEPISYDNRENLAEVFGVGKELFQQDDNIILPRVGAQTETSAFKAWFGDSKVVNPDGSPMVVYHGTESNFDTFDPEQTGKTSDNGWFGKGLYFSPRADEASRYATVKRESPGYGDDIAKGSVMPVYLKAENPFETEQQSFNQTYVDRLRAEGYDAIFRVDQLGDEIPQEIVVFEPTQIKSAIGNNGDFNPNDERILNQSVLFYSALSRAVGNSKQVKAPASQWKSILLNTSGVKADELYWTGLEELLDFDPKAMFTREQLADILAKGGIQVEEVLLGRLSEAEITKAVDVLYEERSRALREVAGDYYEPTYFPAQVTEDDDGNELETLYWIVQDNQGDQAIEETFDDEDAAIEAAQEQDANNESEFITDYINGNVSYADLREEVERDYKAQFQNWTSDPSDPSNRELLITLPIGKGGNPAKAPSTHWDQPAVVAHLRFRVITNPDGTQTMKIEEVQSDWHQKGRDQGYSGQTDPAIIEAAKNKFIDAQAAENEARSTYQATGGEVYPAIREFAFAARDAMFARVDQEQTEKFETWKGIVSRHLNLEVDPTIQHPEALLTTYKAAFNLTSVQPTEEQEQAGIKLEIAREKLEQATRDTRLAEREFGAAQNPDGIPDAPFKTTWPALVMKRAIRWAADNDIDQIVWTSGKEQAERYNLSSATGPLMVAAPTTEGGTYRVGMNSDAASKLANANLGEMYNGTFGESILRMTPEQMKEAFGAGITKRAIEGAAAVAESQNDIVAAAQARFDEADRAYTDTLATNLGIDSPDTNAVNATYRKSQEAGRALDEAQNAVFIMEGEDLSVGGEGMKAFYDRNLANITNDIIKKFGAKVKPIYVPDTRPYSALGTLESGLRNIEAGIRDDESLASIDQDAERRLPDAYAKRDEFEADIAKLKQPANLGFDITPQLKEAAAGGFPLFQKNKDPAERPRARIVFARATGSEGFHIELFENRNLSSLLHEVGHLRLEQLFEDAEVEGANPRLKGMKATVLEWMRKNGHEVIDGKIPERAHEQWADTWETYIREGRAPSIGLKRVFEMFRTWMVGIYKNDRIKNANLTPEIRDVMDRLIASDEQVETARAEQNLQQLFADAAAIGMNEGEFANYQEQVDSARAEASGTVLERAMKAARDRENKLYKERKRIVKAKVDEDLDEEPLFRALAVLRDNRMDKDWLLENMGADVLSQLPVRVPPLYQQGGMDPEMVAEIAGFGSADLMLDVLFAAQAEHAAAKADGDERAMKARMLDARVDAQLKAEFGDPLTDGEIETEALAAVNNERQGEVQASEIRALARKTGKKPTPYKIAREWAREKVRRGVYVLEASPQAIQRHAMAVAKAGREAEEAFIKGDFEAALRAKERQMLSGALLAEAKIANSEVERAKKRMAKIAKVRTMRSVDQDYLETAQGLLEAVEFKDRSQIFLDRKGKWEAFAALRRAEGYDVVTPEGYEAMLGTEHWSRLTVEELLGLDEAVKQVLHLGRNAQNMINSIEKQATAALVAEVQANGAAIGMKDKGSQLDNDLSIFDRIRSNVASIDAALLKLEAIFDWLDNGNPNGPFNRFVFRPIADAQARERDMLQDYYDRMRRAFEMVDPKTLKSWASRVTFPNMSDPKTGEVLVIPLQKIIAMALNWGNAGNRQRLSDGFGFSERAMEFIIMDTLTEGEWAFVQETWDIFDSLWPEISAIERNVNGVEPDKIEAIEVVTPYGTLKGGYYPAIYDRSLDRKSAQQGGEADDLLGATMTRATTRASSTKARSETVKRPLLLDLGVINRHLGEVIHDITHREAVIQAYKFLSNDDVLDVVDGVLGKEYSDQLLPWVKYVANSWAHDSAGMQGVGKWFGKFRANATIVGMGFRYTTIVTQMAGYANSFEAVGERWVAPEIARFSAQLAVMAGKTAAFQPELPPMVQFVREKSGEMRGRQDTLDQNINEQLKTLLMPKWQGGAMTAATSAKVFAFHGIGYMDMLVTVPTWMGAYNKAMAKHGDEGLAIYEADKAIRLSQGAGAPKDLAHIQRSTGKWGEALKLLTMYYSYVSALYSRQRTLGRDASNAKMAELPRILARSWWLLIAPTFIVAFLKGEGPDEEEDPAAWAFSEMLFNNVGAIPVVRDAVKPAWARATGKPTFGYTLSPVQGLGQTTVNVAGDIGNMVEGDPTKRATRNALELVGYSTGLVPGQFAASAQFFVDVNAGEQNPKDMGDWYEGITRGKIKEKE